MIRQEMDLQEIQSELRRLMSYDDVPEEDETFLLD